MIAASQRIMDFVLEKAESEPLARRILLYRDVASLTADSTRAAAFAALASELESIERRHRQLRLNLGEDRDGNGAKA